MSVIDFNCVENQIKSAALQSKACPACERHGYPILLLRKSALRHDMLPRSFYYGDVPDLGDREPNEPFQDHRPVLRTLREGYVYVLGGTLHNKRYIAQYEVTRDGALREKSLDDLGLDAIAPLPKACVHKNHFVPAAFMNIEWTEETLTSTPHLWIAYSRYAWDQATRDYYQQGNDLARFSHVDLAAFSVAPASHPRGIDLPINYLSPQATFVPVLEFLSYSDDEIATLPYYQDRSRQLKEYVSFVGKAHYRNASRKIGALVLEDAFGMLEDLNHQRNAEVNYTGDAGLHKKTDAQSPHLPYTYNALLDEAMMHKKATADLIDKYEASLREDFNQRAVAGTVFVSGIENLYRTVLGETWQYGGNSEIMDDTGSILYRLSPSEKAQYDFDAYWQSLMSQIRGRALTEFKQEYARREAEVEELHQHAPRDYTLYLRWLLGKPKSLSPYAAGQPMTTSTVFDVENGEQNGEQSALDTNQITFPSQLIARYNTVFYWQREVDMANIDHYCEWLSELTTVLSGNNTAYYTLAVWDELLADKNSLIYSATAGKETSFWSSSQQRDVYSRYTHFLVMMMDGLLVGWLVASLLTWRKRYNKCSALPRLLHAPIPKRS